MNSGARDGGPPASAPRPCGRQGGARTARGAHGGQEGRQRRQRRVRGDRAQQPEALVVLRLAGHQLLEHAQHRLPRRPPRASAPPEHCRH